MKKQIPEHAKRLLTGLAVFFFLALIMQCIIYGANHYQNITAAAVLCFLSYCVGGSLMEKLNPKTIPEDKEMVFEAFEHEYYDDTGGRHIHCWFVTYEDWETYSFGKEFKLIRTRSLIYG